MERWRAGRRSLVLDTRASQYIGRLFCSGPAPASVESSPWKLSDSFTVEAAAAARGPEDARTKPQPSSPGPGSPRPPPVTPRRRARSSSGSGLARARPASVSGLSSSGLSEGYAQTRSFLQAR